MDPKADWYYSLSPYNYVANNPIILKDPNGKWIESAWDVASLGMGINSLVKNVREGNVTDAIIDGVGIVADGTALALPFVPGGAGATIKAVRATDKVTDAAKTLSKNKSVGKQGEKIVTESLKKEVGDGKEVLEQVSAKYEDGSRTVFDNVVVDKKTGNVDLTNETKTGNADYTGQQSRYHQDGESATFTGKKARDAGIEGQTVNKNTTGNRTTRVNRQDLE